MPRVGDRGLACYREAGRDEQGRMTYQSSPQRVLDLATVTRVARKTTATLLPLSAAHGGRPDNAFEVVAPGRVFGFAPDPEEVEEGSGPGLDWQRVIAMAVDRARELSSSRRLVRGVGAALGARRAPPAALDLDIDQDGVITKDELLHAERGVLVLSGNVCDEFVFKSNCFRKTDDKHKQSLFSSHS